MYKSKEHKTGMPDFLSQLKFPFNSNDSKDTTHVLYVNTQHNCPACVEEILKTFEKHKDKPNYYIVISSSNPVRVKQIQEKYLKKLYKNIIYDNNLISEQVLPVYESVRYVKLVGNSIVKEIPLSYTDVVFYSDDFSL